MPKAPHTTFNDYYVIAGPPKPPKDSWWVCQPDQFYVTAKTHKKRMEGSREAASIKPLTLGGILP